MSKGLTYQKFNFFIKLGKILEFLFPRIFHNHPYHCALDTYHCGAVVTALRGSNSKM